MSLFRLLLRNISGDAFRSGVVSLCVLLVASLTLATTLIIRGTETSLRLALARLGADIIVVPEGTQAKVETALLMGIPASVWMPQANLDKVAALPGVAIASPQFYLSTLVDAACCAVSDMFLVAYDPSTDFTIEPWLKKRSGTGLRLGEAVGGTYIFVPEGEQNIKLYGYFLTLKDNLEPTGSGLDQSMFITFETARDMARISLTRAVKPLEIAPESISAVMIKLKPGYSPRDVAQEIRRVVPGVTPIESSNLFRAYRSQMTAMLQSILLVLGITWVLAVVLIGLVFSMAANERRRELSVLRTLGATRRMVFQLLLSEAGALALGGGGVGMVVTAMGVYLFRRLIVSLGVPFLFPAPAALLAQVGVVLLVALAAGTLAALLPAYRISRQDSAVAMRE